MADAARAAGVGHMINHQSRQSPPLLRAGELIAAGYLGRPTVADIVLVYNPADHLRSPAGSPSKTARYTDAGQAGGAFFSAAGPHRYRRLYRHPLADMTRDILARRAEVCYSLLRER